MEIVTQEQLKAHLMDTNEEFRKLAEQHCEYAKKLDEMIARNHLSEQEKVEEIRLKKLKLRLKDQMEIILSRHRAQLVA